MAGDQQNAKIFEPVVPRWRQREFVTDPVQQRIRSGQHIELDCEIGGPARHRTDDSEIATRRYRG